MNIEVPEDTKYVWKKRIKEAPIDIVNGIKYQSEEETIEYQMSEVLKDKFIITTFEENMGYQMIDECSISISPDKKRIEWSNDINSGVIELA